MFSISADEVQDISNKEQLAIIVHFVDKNGELFKRQQITISVAAAFF